MKPTHKKNTTTPLFGLTTIGEKGQIVIPAEIREFLHLKKSEKLMIIARDHALVLVRPSQMEPLIAGFASVAEKFKKSK